MKRAVLLTLFLFLIPSTAPSTPSSGSFIVPGERIGPWTLALTIHQLERLFGAPKPCRDEVETDHLVPLRAYCVEAVDVFFLAKAQPVHIRVSQITAFSRTAEGIGIGSSLSAILAAYGRPTAITRLGDDFAGYTRVIYDGLGLALRLNAVTKTVVAISIFRPGTARSIWRF